MPGCGGEGEAVADVAGLGRREAEALRIDAVLDHRDAFRRDAELADQQLLDAA